MQPASIGIVSFKNMPADAQAGITVTVLFTQTSDTTGGVENTTHDVGLGTDCTVIPNIGGAAQAGISTRAFVGGGPHSLVYLQLQEIKSLFHSLCITTVGQILMRIVTTSSLPRTDNLDLVL